MKAYLTWITGKLIKQFGWQLLILVLLLSIGVIDKARQKARERALEDNIARFKLEMVSQWEQDSLAIVKQAEIADSLEGILLTNINLQVKYKKLYFGLLEAEQETIGEREQVTFTREDKCVWIHGRTLTNPPQSDLLIIHKPISLEIALMDINGDKVIGKVRPSNDCLEIEKVKFVVAPGFGQVEQKRFGWKEFIVGGIIGGITVFLIH